MNIRSVLALVSIIGGAASPALHAQAFTFQTFSVPGALQGSAGTVGVNGINDTGTVSGFLVTPSGAYEGFLRDSSGKFTFLNDPADTTVPSFTFANKSNIHGTVVGFFSNTAAGVYSGFLYNGASYTTYNLPDEPAGSSTLIYGINDFGDTCGQVLPAGGVPQAFVVVDGKPSTFIVSGSGFSFCEAINDQGVAVGGYVDSLGVYHGWIRQADGSVQTYNAPGASIRTGSVFCYGTNGGTVLTGINNVGAMAGLYVDTTYKLHGFTVSTDGGFQPVDVPGAASTSGGGINDRGVFVGHWSDKSCNNYGYIATPSIFVF